MARAAGVALALLFFPPSAHPAGAEEISAPRARALAFELVALGRPDEAAELARVLVEREPTDQAAWLALAQAETRRGRPDAGYEAAREAWRLADTSGERYAAAVVAARALASRGAYLRGQLWLRRAVQATDDPALRARAVKEFRQVRAKSPWRIRAGGYVQPSDNLNDAPTTNRFVFGGVELVNPSAVPLTGLRYGAHVSAVRRTPLAERLGLLTGISAGVHRVAISPDSRRKVPGIDNADLAQDQFAALLGIAWSGAQGGRWGRAVLSAGRTWYGGPPLADRLALRVEQGFATGPKGSAVLGFSLAREERHDSASRDSVDLGVSARWTRALSRAVTLELGARVTDTRSDSAAVARIERGLSLAWRTRRGDATIQPGIVLDYEAAGYRRPLYGPEPRRDDAITLTLEARLPRASMYGFAPVISLSRRWRHSNVSLFESRSTDLRIGIVSLF